VFYGHLPTFESGSSPHYNEADVRKRLEAIASETAPEKRCFEVVEDGNAHFSA
jgi:hypothetical protein